MIALAGLLFFILLMPAYNGLSARRTALDERNRLIAERTDILAKINELKQESAKRAGDIRQFSYVVPAGKAPADLVAMIQTLASQNGLQLTSLAMGAGNNDEKAPYLAQSIDLGLAGGYAAFRSFIESLEKNVRIIDIESIDAAPTTENSPVIGFRIKARAYFISSR